MTSGREFINSVLIFDQSSSRKFIECRPRKSLQFFQFIEIFLMSFTKIPILFWKFSSKLFISCMSMVNFSSLGFDNSIQFLNTSSIRIGLKFVFVNLCSKVSDNLLFFVFQGESWWFRFPFRDLILSARTKFVHGSHRSCVCVKKDWSWQQTFFIRVISLSSVRWFSSLLNEQWWRKHFLDGLIVEFRVTQVRGLRIFVAWFFLEDHFSSLWAVEVVKELGLINCGEDVAREQYSSLCEGAAGVSLGAVHMEEGVQVRVQVECGIEKAGDRKEHGERQNEDTSNRQSTAHHGWH